MTFTYIVYVMIYVNTVHLNENKLSVQGQALYGIDVYHPWALIILGELNERRMDQALAKNIR